MHLKSFWKGSAYLLTFLPTTCYYASTPATYLRSFYGHCSNYLDCPFYSRSHCVSHSKAHIRVVYDHMDLLGLVRNSTSPRYGLRSLLHVMNITVPLFFVKLPPIRDTCGFNRSRSTRNERSEARLKTAIASAVRRTHTLERSAPKLRRPVRQTSRRTWPGASLLLRRLFGADTINQNAQTFQG
jgi:hypothetical protein